MNFNIDHVALTRDVCTYDAPTLATHRCVGQTQPLHLHHIATCTLFFVCVKVYRAKKGE